MSASNPTLSDMQSAVKETVRLHWQLFLTQGVIMLILGILAVIWPGISTIAVDVYVGWLFLFSGIVGLFTMFVARDTQAFLWMLLTAALALFVGIILLWHPAEGAVSLTAVLTAFFIVEGIFPDRGISQLSRHVPQPMGMDVGKRHRRSDPRRHHHCGLAGHRDLGARFNRRRQPNHFGRCHHHGGVSRTKFRQDASTRTPIGA